MVSPNLEDLPHLQCILDFQGHIKQVNTAWQQQLGIMVQHLLVTTFTHWVHSEDLAHTQESLTQLSQGKTDRIVFENRVRDIAGKYRWLIWVMTASLKKGFIYAIGLEMPAREQNEVRLHETEQRYQTIINQLLQGLLIYGVDGKIMACNPSTEKILGLKADQLLGRATWNLMTIHEDSSDFPKESHPAAVTSRTGKICIAEVMGIYKHDNTITWLSINSLPLLSTSKLPPFPVVSTLTDISEYKEKRDTLGEKVKLFSAILNIIKMGIAVTDAQGCFVQVNSAYCQMYGYRAEELLGQSFTLFLPPPLQPESVQAHRDFLADNATHSGQWSMQHRDGRILNYPVTENKLLIDESKRFKVTVVTQLSEEVEELPQLFDLTNNDSWLRLLLRQLPVTVLSLDRKGRLTFIEGQHIELLLGLPVEKCLGQSIFEVSPRLTPLIPDFKRALGGETFNKVIVYAGVSFKTKYMPLLKANEWVGILMVFHDITEQRILKLRLERSMQELELLASHTSIGLMYLEQQQKIVRVNKECADLLGYTQTELLKLSAERLFRTLDDYIHFQQQAGIHLRKEESYDTLLWLRKKEGTYVYGRITVKALSQSNRTLWLLEETKEPDHRQSNTTVSLQAAFWSTTSDAILIMDPLLRILQANPASSKLTGYTPEELVNKSLPELNSGQQNSQFYQNVMDSIVQQGQWQGHLWQRHKSNMAYLCELKLQAFDSATGVASRYLAILSHNHSHNTAFADPLTGLPSKQLFLHKLSKTHALCQRNKKFFAILLIGIDNMSAINIKYGCIIGDQFLYTIGQILKSSVRDSDTVARYGGNMFSVNLDEISKPEDACLVSQVMLFKLTQPFVLQEQSVQASVSIGVVVYPEDGTQVDILLERAKQTLEQVQTQGGGRCGFHSPRF
jgi:diguanylate cyclase (GGDEF)-like protein/PAS domain S-box-containing protein